LFDYRLYGWTTCTVPIPTLL